MSGATAIRAGTNNCYDPTSPDGLVAEFHVMVRPPGALTALERAVTERISA